MWKGSLPRLLPHLVAQTWKVLVLVFSSLISPYISTKVCGVFNNRVLTNSSSGQPGRKARVCLVWGLLEDPWPTHNEMSLIWPWGFCLGTLDFLIQHHPECSPVTLSLSTYSFRLAYTAVSFHIAFPYNLMFVQSFLLPLPPHSLLKLSTPPFTSSVLCFPSTLRYHSLQCPSLTSLLLRLAPRSKDPCMRESIQCSSIGVWVTLLHIVFLAPFIFLKIAYFHFSL